MVAANEEVRIWGDPHVIGLGGSDGDKYDFAPAHKNLPGPYSILNDKNININGEMVSTGNPDQVCVMKEAGLTLGDKKLQISNEGINLNGQALNLGVGQASDLGNGNSIKRIKDKMLEIQTPEYTVTVEQMGGYLDMNVKSKAQGVLADGVAPTGVLGELFDRDKTPQHAPKLGDTEKYRTKDLFDGPNRQSPNITFQHYVNAATNHIANRGTNGKLSLAEFTRDYTGVKLGNDNDAKNAFSLYDSDNDGNLDVKETARIFQASDFDRDGNVPMDETRDFYGNIKEYFAASAGINKEGGFRSKETYIKDYVNAGLGNAAEAEQAFRHFDIENDGKHSLAETARHFESSDVNRDGKATWDESKKMFNNIKTYSKVSSDLLAKTGGTRTEAQFVKDYVDAQLGDANQAKAAFKEFDANGDGKHDLAETARIFQSSDANRDGTTTWDESRAFYSKFLR